MDPLLPYIPVQHRYILHGYLGMWLHISRLKVIVQEEMEEEYDVREYALYDGEIEWLIHTN